MSAWYTVNFSLANNADWEQEFQMKDTAGAAIDLTGAAFEMDVRDRAGTEILTLTTGNARIVITNAAAGNFKLIVPASVMRTLPTGGYAHDLLRVQAGKTERIWAGTVEIFKGVSA